jgi:hypothetical protein
MGSSLGRLGAGLLFIAVSVTHAATLAVNDTPRRGDLGGTWILQRDLGEPPKPPQRGRNAPADPGGPGGQGGRGGPGGGPPGGGPPGGMGGMGGGPGGPGGPGGGMAPPKPPTEEEIARMREVVLPAFDPASTLTIRQTGTDVTLAFGDASPETFTTDGKKHKSASSLGEVEHKARWKDDRLIVETKLKEGLKTTRTFWIEDTSATRALVMTIEVKGGKLLATVEARYVYHVAKT